MGAACWVRSGSYSRLILGVIGEWGRGTEEGEEDATAYHQLAGLGATVSTRPPPSQPATSPAHRVRHTSGAGGLYLVTFALLWRLARGHIENVVVMSGICGVMLMITAVAS